MEGDWHSSRCGGTERIGGSLLGVDNCKRQFFLGGRHLYGGNRLEEDTVGGRFTGGRHLYKEHSAGRRHLYGDTLLAGDTYMGSLY